jgi:hypothetical protein
VFHPLGTDKFSAVRENKRFKNKGQNCGLLNTFPKARGWKEKHRSKGDALTKETCQLVLMPVIPATQEAEIRRISV